MIIDCHCHAGKGDGLTGPWDTDATLTRYRKRARAANIQKTILFSVFCSDYATANRAVGEIVLREPQTFLGFAFVHPRRDKGRIYDMVLEAAEQYGFCGIKVHRHDGRICREVCDTATKLGLPVLYDLAGEAEVARILAEEYPEVDFIIPHLGSFADDWRAQTALIGHIERYPNIFTDTAGVRRFDLIAETIRRAGPHKVLFGSDGPWLHPGLELHKIKLLGLSPEAYSMVTGGNIQKLIDKVRSK